MRFYIFTEITRRSIAASAITDQLASTTIVGWDEYRHCAMLVDDFGVACTTIWVD